MIPQLILQHLEIITKEESIMTTFQHIFLQNSATSPSLTIDDTSFTVNKNMNFINSDMFYFQSEGIVFLHILLITKFCQHSSIIAMLIIPH